MQYLYVCTTVSFPGPPIPTNVTAQLINASSFRVAWQWTSSGPAPNCFNTTHVTYRPEGGGGSSLQLSDPAANEATLTDFQNNRCYTITVVATAGEHRKEGVTLQGAIWKSACVQCMFICTGTTSMCPEVSGKLLLQEWNLVILLCSWLRFVKWPRSIHWPRSVYWRMCVHWHKSVHWPKSRWASFMWV